MTKEQAQTIKEYYEGLPKKIVIAPKNDFIKKVCIKCKVTKMTVRRWINGDTVPDKQQQATIAMIVKIPAKALFPLQK